MVSLGLSQVQFLVAHVAIAGVVYVSVQDYGRSTALLAALAAVALPFALAFFGVGLVNTLVIELVVLSAYFIRNQYRDGRISHSLNH
ncbi:hypothetical protein ACFPYI_05540 [Halomarina salina]|uniref:Uncharacterized protein n=1 Tax=Halomarina salina TaxID=1872699 RepID=A0ABD5RJM9_9EURY|nr:hypothetical protein [Halomarina salina]